MHVTFFSWNGLDHPVPKGTTVSGQYYIVHPCRVRWGGLFAVNLKYLRMVSFCSRIMQHLITIVMCKVWWNVGAERCWDIVPTSQISPHVVISKEHLRVKRFESEDYINTAVTAPLYRLSRDEYKPAVGRYHIGGKNVCGHCWWLHLVEDISYV